MDKKEIKARVHDLLATGTAKSTVFAQLSGQGVKDSQLAHMIASYADPARCDAQAGKVKLLAFLMVLQAIAAFFLGFGIGSAIGPNARWIVAGVAALIPLLLAWGFDDHRAWAYNAYIVLTLVQLPRSFEGFAAAPTSALVFPAINIALLGFVWYLRSKIFPDFAFINVRKSKGSYVFAD